MDIVRCLKKIFGWLREVTLLELVCRILGRTEDDAKNCFIEFWSLGWFIAAMLLFICSYYFSIGGFWRWFIVALAGYQVYELTITHVNILLFDWFERDNYFLVSRARSVILTLLNFAEIIFWFALAYGKLTWLNSCGRGVSLGWLDALTLSFQTMTSFGNADFSPCVFEAKVLTLLQATIGLFMLAGVLARFINILPEPGRGKSDKTGDNTGGLEFKTEDVETTEQSETEKIEPEKETRILLVVSVMLVVLAGCGILKKLRADCEN